MAKEEQRINRFDAGIVNGPNPRDISDAAAQDMAGLDPFLVGSLRASGRCKVASAPLFPNTFLFLANRNNYNYEDKDIYLHDGGAGGSMTKLDGLRRDVVWAAYGGGEDYLHWLQWAPGSGYGLFQFSSDNADLENYFSIRCHPSGALLDDTGPFWDGASTDTNVTDTWTGTDTEGQLGGARIYTILIGYGMLGEPCQKLNGQYEEDTINSPTNHTTQGTDGNGHPIDFSSRGAEYGNPTVMCMLHTYSHEDKGAKANYWTVLGRNVTQGVPLGAEGPLYTPARGNELDIPEPKRFEYMSKIPSSAGTALNDHMDDLTAQMDEVRIPDANFPCNEPYLPKFVQTSRGIRIYDENRKNPSYYLNYVRHGFNKGNPFSPGGKVRQWVFEPNTFQAPFITTDFNQCYKMAVSQIANSNITQIDGYTIPWYNVNDGPNRLHITQIYPGANNQATYATEGHLGYSESLGGSFDNSHKYHNNCPTIGVSKLQQYPFGYIHRDGYTNAHLYQQDVFGSSTDDTIYPWNDGTYRHDIVNQPLHGNSTFDADSCIRRLVNGTRNDSIAVDGVEQTGRGLDNRGSQKLMYKFYEETGGGWSHTSGPIEFYFSYLYDSQGGDDSGQEGPLSMFEPYFYPNNNGSGANAKMFAVSAIHPRPETQEAWETHKQGYMSVSPMVQKSTYNDPAPGTKRRIPGYEELIYQAGTFDTLLNSACKLDITAGMHPGNSYGGVEYAGGYVKEHYDDTTGTNRNSYPGARMTGMRCYWKYKNSSDDTTLYLLYEMDYEKGYKVGGGEWAPLNEACGFRHTFDTPPQFETFVDINLYEPFADVALNYGTAIWHKNRMWAGNTFVDGVVNSDRIYKSAVGQPDIFPKNQHVDIVSDDGDEVVALRAYKDELLVFKKNRLYVLDIADLDEERLLGSFIDRGVPTENCVCESPEGLVFVNQFGAFMYTGGGEVQNLLVEENVTKIDGETWRDYFGVDDTSNLSVDFKANIQYNSQSNKVIILRNNAATTVYNSTCSGTDGSTAIDHTAGGSMANLKLGQRVSMMTDGTNHIPADSFVAEIISTTQFKINNPVSGDFNTSTDYMTDGRNEALVFKGGDGEGDTLEYSLTTKSWTRTGGTFPQSAREISTYPLGEKNPFWEPDMGIGDNNTFTVDAEQLEKVSQTWCTNIIKDYQGGILMAGECHNFHTLDFRSIPRRSSNHSGDSDGKESIGLRGGTVGDIYGSGNYDNAGSHRVFIGSTSHLPRYGLINNQPKIKFFRWSEDRDKVDTTDMIQAGDIYWESKEFDMGTSGAKKDIKKVYITYRALAEDGTGQGDTNLNVYYALDGTDQSPNQFGSEVYRHLFRDNGNFSDYQMNIGVAASIAYKQVGGLQGTGTIDSTVGANEANNGAFVQWRTAELKPLVAHSKKANSFKIIIANPGGDVQRSLLNIDEITIIYKTRSIK